MPAWRLRTQPYGEISTVAIGAKRQSVLECHSVPLSPIHIHIHIHIRIRIHIRIHIHIRIRIRIHIHIHIHIHIYIYIIIKNPTQTSKPTLQTSNLMLFLFKWFLRVAKAQNSLLFACFRRWWFRSLHRFAHKKLPQLVVRFAVWCRLTLGHLGHTKCQDTQKKKWGLEFGEYCWDIFIWELGSSALLKRKKRNRFRTVTSSGNGSFSHSLWRKYVSICMYVFVYIYISCVSQVIATCRVHEKININFSHPTNCGCETPGNISSPVKLKITRISPTKLIDFQSTTGFFNG